VRPSSPPRLDDALLPGYTQPPDEYGFHEMNEPSPLYLDYNATTPTDPRVAEAMIPYLTELHGNPSSAHALGREVRAGVNRARNQVAALIGASPDEIVFTSGGSEANNHALKGVAHALRDRPGRTIVISAVEHPAVYMPCCFLAECGVRIVTVPVDRHGRVDPDDVRKALTPETILVSIMHANNEVGTIQPIAEIAAITRRAGVLLHTDAAQTIGKIPVNVEALGVDLLTIAGHKVCAPQGVGALYIREGVKLEPLIHGAGHEKGRRAGTEAVPAIVGLGMAAEIAAAELRAGTSERIRGLRDKLHERLKARLGDRIALNGHPAERLPNTLNLGFRGQIGVYLLEAMQGVCASPGAACHADTVAPSPVLEAMQVPREVAMGAIRFSLGRPTTEAEIDDAVERIAKAMQV
jgi:cysteine desulfurase